MRPIIASDLMTPEVLTVPMDLTVAELATFLVENEITGAAVRDASGKVVGVVSMVDIAAAAAEEGDIEADRGRSNFYLRGWEESLDEEELSGLHLENEGLLVRDIMNPAVYSVSHDTPVSEVARTMLDGHLHRLLVTGDEGLVGIISTSDLLGLLVEEE